MKLKTLAAVCAGLFSSMALAADENKLTVMASSAQISQVLDSSKMGSKLKLKINKLRARGIAQDEELFDVYIVLKNESTEGLGSRPTKAQDKFLISLSHNGKGLKGMIRYKNIPVVRAQLSLSQLEEMSLNADVQKINIKKVYKKFDADGHSLTDVDLAQNAGFSLQFY